jgi:hypothetical protein
MSVKRMVFGAVTPCSSEAAKYSGRIYHLLSSGSKSKPSKKPTEATDFLLGSYFESEDGGDILLSNVWHLQNNMALQSRRLQSS